MRPTTSARTFLLCFALFLIVPLSCFAQTATPEGGTQFTNGQTGTPNLPLAASCTIDKTHFAIEISGVASGASDLIQRKRTFLRNVAPTAANLRDTDSAGNQAFRDLVNQEFQATEQDKLRQKLITSYLYVGSEARVGSGRPIYALPALSYGDDRFGIQLGGESFYEFGSEADRGVDSLGLSFKVEVTDVARGLARKVAAVKEIQKRVDAAKLEPDSGSNDANKSDIEVLNNLVNTDLNKNILRIQKIAAPYNFFTGGAATPKTTNPPKTPTDLDAALNSLSDESMNLLNDYVRKTRYPVVSVIAGDRLVNDGGSLPQTGVSASQLFPFSYGGAGVTLLGVVQSFSDDFRGDKHRTAGRFGAALIFQDRTPSKIKTVDKTGIPLSNLGKTWTIKEGFEYTSPILGLHETYAGFITYRDVRTYGEITLTAGKDGLRKDYLDISIGKSFVF